MFRTITLTALAALVMTAGGVRAAEHERHIEDIAFAHEGPFGRFDQFQLQRGLQIYTEVCSGCHGLKFVPIRSLADEGGPMLPEDQVKAYAAGLDTVIDPVSGDERDREWTDPFPIRQGEGMGPDLSLMAKARAGFHGPYGTGISQLVNGMGGPEYIYSILTGYTGEEKEEFGTYLYENTAFPSGWIAMPPPLSDDSVSFEDGSPTTLPDLAEDVASFLMWTAEPKLMDRRYAGFVSVIFLSVLASLLYLTNKRIWAGVKGNQAG
ncbi:MAG: cytochrome c1 [Rhodobacterales bacterium 17-64-5]|nr:MAG: cytochrome c1 [Rhodobacterales bacterium 17-64-5]